MARQKQLFDAANANTRRFVRAPHNGTETSREAAESVEPRAATMCGKVLASIRIAGTWGRTNSELVERTGLKLQTVCARVAQLREAGLIRDSGEKRRTDTGRRAIVWVAK